MPGKKITSFFKNRSFIKRSFSNSSALLSILMVLILFTSFTPSSTASNAYLFTEKCVLAPPTIDITASGKYNLKNLMCYFIDETNQLSIDDIQTNQAIPNYKIFEQASISKPNANYWLSFTLENKKKKAVTRILALNDILINEATLYRDDSNFSSTTGFKIPYSQTPLKQRLFAFEIEIPPESKITFYLKLNSSFYLVFQPYIIDPINMIQQGETSSTKSYILIGMLSGVFIYMLIIFIHTREFDKSLINFCLFLLASTSLLLHMNGFLLPYLLDNPWLQVNAYNIIITLVATFFLLSCNQQFFDFEEFSYIAPASKISISLFTLLSLSTLFYPPEYISVYIVYLASFIMLLLALFCIILIIRRKGKAPQLAVGSVFFLITTIIANLGTMGLYNLPWLARHGFELGLSFIGIFMALTISDRIILYRKETTEMAQEAATAVAKGEAKSQFLAKMSHEIRTPLNGIIGILDLMKDTSLDSQQKDYLKLIEHSNENLLKVINDILDYSKIEANKLEIKPQAFDLLLLINDVSNFYANQCFRKKISFSSFVSPEAPSQVYGDPNRLKQILNNLLANAIQYTDSGLVELKVKVAHQNKNECTIYFSVLDTGKGIPNTQVDNVFESFTQILDNHTNISGTGLGLSICKQLVSLMDGEIGVQSKTNEGSCFWFTIPFAIDIAQPSISSVTSYTTPTLNNEANLSKKILVVEDNVINLEVIKGMLQKLNFELDFAQNGDQALKLLTANHDNYSLILMDCEMPIMDGFTCTGKIRSFEEYYNKQKVPIIAITAHAIPGYKDKCLSAGMDDHLPKPIQRQDLVITLNKWLKH